MSHWETSAPCQVCHHPLCPPRHYRPSMNFQAVFCRYLHECLHGYTFYWHTPMRGAQTWSYLSEQTNDSPSWKALTNTKDQKNMTVLASKRDCRALITLQAALWKGQWLERSLCIVTSPQSPTKVGRKYMFSMEIRSWQNRPGWPSRLAQLHEVGIPPY